MSRLDYIAVEGPIGVGKTTLATRLAKDLSAELLLERPQDNPFLEAFYREPEAKAFQVQLSFLLQRAEQVDGLRQTDLFRRCTVADFFFDKDPLFAQLTLSGSEFTLYRQLFTRLAWEAPRPDKVIYLHAPVDVLVQRVNKRGRSAEQPMTADYLAQVAGAYLDFFADYKDTDLITVNAATLDLVNQPDDYRKVLEAIATPQRRIQLA
ncbi:deoxynucleoside kinase [bacterium]|nr:deoxynucleoside kinase [bacterium]